MILAEKHDVLVNQLSIGDTLYLTCHPVQIPENQLRDFRKLPGRFNSEEYQGFPRHTLQILNVDTSPTGHLYLRLQRLDAPGVNVIGSDFNALPIGELRTTRNRF